MKILYFSWLKEKIGTSSEEIVKPKKVENVMDLIQFLQNVSDGHKEAFTHLKNIKVAVNKNFASFKTEIKNNDEIAFFPPVTGG